VFGWETATVIWKQLLMRDGVCVCEAVPDSERVAVGLGEVDRLPDWVSLGVAVALGVVVTLADALCVTLEDCDCDGVAVRLDVSLCVTLGECD